MDTIPTPNPSVLDDLRTMYTVSPEELSPDSGIRQFIERHAQALNVVPDLDSWVILRQPPLILPPQQGGIVRHTPIIDDTHEPHVKLGGIFLDDPNLRRAFVYLLGTFHIDGRPKFHYKSLPNPPYDLDALKLALLDHKVKKSLEGLELGEDTQAIMSKKAYQDTVTALFDLGRGVITLLTTGRTIG